MPPPTTRRGTRAARRGRRGRRGTGAASRSVARSRDPPPSARAGAATPPAGSRGDVKRSRRPRTGRRGAARAPPGGWDRPAPEVPVRKPLLTVSYNFSSRVSRVDERAGVLLEDDAPRDPLEQFR